jgi:hypothetical protein
VIGCFERTDFGPRVPTDAGAFFHAGTCTMLPPSEFNRFQRICLNGLSNPDLLTDWDRNFLQDYANKFVKFQRHTFVSDSQEEQFDRIEKYLKEELRHDYED